MCNDRWSRGCALGRKAMQAVCFVLSTVILCYSVASAGDAQGNADCRDVIVDKVRSVLVDRVFATEGDLVEDYPEKGYRIISSKQILFTGIVVTSEGFSFDVMVSTNLQKITEKGGVVEADKQVTVIRKVELRPLPQSKRCIGFSRTVFHSSKDETGKCESVELFIEGGQLIMHYKDIGIRFDSNDGVAITSETKSTVSSGVSGGSEVSVDYVEREIEPKTRVSGKERFNVTLSYKQIGKRASVK